MGKGNDPNCVLALPMPSPLTKRRSSPRVTVTICEATDADVPQLAELKRAVAREAYQPAHAGAALERWLDEHCTEAHYRYRVGRKAYTVLVARDDAGTLVGVATMRQRGQRADMSGLYVAARGQGIGRQLVEAREAHARRLGCIRIRASVWRTNDAGTAFVRAQGMTRRGGYREQTVGVMVDHYERDL